MDYRYEATTVTGFVQMLAANYLPHGFWYYLRGKVPEHKDPAKADAQIIAAYEINIREGQRRYRSQRGLANCHYLRFERDWIVLCNGGIHPFMTANVRQIKDARHDPIYIRGYSISVKPGGVLKKQPGQTKAKKDPKMRVRVIMSREAYQMELTYFRENAYLPVRELAQLFADIPFEPYAPIRKQWLQILRQVNGLRRKRGLERLPESVLRLRRKIVKPFGPLNNNTITKRKNAGKEERLQVVLTNSQAIGFIRAAIETGPFTSCREFVEHMTTVYRNLEQVEDVTDLPELLKRKAVNGGRAATAKDRKRG